MIESRCMKVIKTEQRPFDTHADPRQTVYCGMHKHNRQISDSASEPEVFATQKSFARVFCQLIFIIENGNRTRSFERLNYIV